MMFTLNGQLYNITYIWSEFRTFLPVPIPLVMGQVHQDFCNHREMVVFLFFGDHPMLFYDYYDQ